MCQRISFGHCFSNFKSVEKENKLKASSNLTKLDCGLGQSQTFIIGETKATTKLGRNPSRALVEPIRNF